MRPQAFGQTSRRGGRSILWLGPGLFYPCGPIDRLTRTSDCHILTTFDSALLETLIKLREEHDGSEAGQLTDGAAQLTYARGVSQVLSPDGVLLAQHIETRGDSGIIAICLADAKFRTPTNTKLALHIFVADKGDYYDIADGVPQNQQ